MNSDEKIKFISKAEIYIVGILIILFILELIFGSIIGIIGIGFLILVHFAYLWLVGGFKSKTKNTAAPKNNLKDTWDSFKHLDPQKIINIFPVVEKKNENKGDNTWQQEF